MANKEIKDYEGEATVARDDLLLTQTSDFTKYNAPTIAEALGLLQSSDLPAASSSGQGVVPTTAGQSTGDKLRVKSDLTLEWYTPSVDDEKASKLYDSTGSAAAVEVDAAGDVSVTTGDLSVAGLINAADGSSLLKRTSGADNNVTTHCTDTISAPWQWTPSAPYIIYRENTLWGVYGGNTLLYQSIAPTSSVRITARVGITSLVSRFGCRIENATGDYIEVTLQVGSGGTCQIVSDINGSTVTHYPNMLLPDFYIFGLNAATTSYEVEMYDLSGRIKFILRSSYGGAPFNASDATKAGLILSSGGTSSKHIAYVDWIGLSVV